MQPLAVLPLLRAPPALSSASSESAVQSMFPRYLFESRQTERNVTVGGWSYVWAGLLGPLYVLCKGGRQYVFHALALTAALMLALTALVAVTSYITAVMQTIAIILALPIGLLVQSVKTVAILKTAYRRRGWRVRTAD
jgi:hypothetical protein